MMLQVGDDGVVSSVNEEDLIYVDKKELEQFIESYQKLEKENEQLQQQLNYIQNSISEHIKHQKTELGQKALKDRNCRIKEIKKSVNLQ